MILAVDFDGTIVEHEFPYIGEPIIGAFECLCALRKMGHKLILWTCRSGEELKQAVEYCRINGLEFDAVNKNIEGLGFSPTPKVYADVYIDDRDIFTKVGQEFWVAVYWELKDKKI